MSRPNRPLSQAEIEAAASDWIVRRDRGLTPGEQQQLSNWQAAHPSHAETIARHEQTWTLLDRPRTHGLSF